MTTAEDKLGDKQRVDDLVRFRLRLRGQNGIHSNIGGQPRRRRRIAAKTAIRMAIAARLAIPNAAMIGTE